LKLKTGPAFEQNSAQKMGKKRAFFEKKDEKSNKSEKN